MMEATESTEGTESLIAPSSGAVTPTTEGTGASVADNPQGDQPYQLNVDRSPVVEASPTVRVVNEDGAETPPASPGERANWWYSEEIGGKGEKPDWFNEKSYKTVEDQAKAHNELRKKLASFTGSPEEGYEITLDEKFGDFAIDEEDPFLNRFAEMAKEMNMSQDGFNQILNMYANEVQEIKAQEAAESEQHWKAELEKLGANGQEELKILQQWSRNALPQELYETFDNMVTSAEVVQVFNKIMEQAIPSKINHVPHVETITRHQLQELMAHKDYGRNDDYTRSVDAQANSLYGRANKYD